MVFVLLLTLFGLLIALRPLGLTAVLLLLAGDRGVVRSIGFVIGWALTIGLIGVVVIVAFHGAATASSARFATKAAASLELLLGVAAISSAVTVHNRAKRRTAPRPPARWPERLNRVGIPMAAAAGVIAVSHVTAAAASIEIYRQQLTSAQDATALVWLAIIGTSGVMIPTILVAVAPGRFRPLLTRMSRAIDARSDRLAVIVLAVLGAYLTARGLQGLA